MQNQLPLFLSYNQVRDLPIVTKYQKIFDELDLSNISEFNFGIGANGISQHALVRAFIIRSLESLNTVSALIRFLQSNPALTFLCGFHNQKIPHDSQFYRFLKKTSHSAIEDLLYRTNKTLIEENTMSLNITAVDSKPIKALTRHNNPKNPNRESKDKNKKIKRNPKATLGYYSYVPETDPHTRKKHFTFFWGYRSHAVVDASSGLVIVEGTFPNNISDETVARKLYKKLKRLYKSKKGMIIIADKAYDVRDFYTFIVNHIKAQPIICLNPRNTQRNLKYSDKGHRICQAGLEMIPNGIFKDGNRLRLKERCPLKASKKIAADYPNGCPCHNPKFERYGCTAYQDLTDDARSKVQRNTPRFNKLYARRFVVEQTFSRLQELEIEEARHYSLTAIRNSNTIDYLALALVALVAVRIKRPEKIRCFRTFLKAA
ncbi:MAG: transposase [Desulfobacterales bacterium]|nr:transposase [Desulfobacterales bacterium]